MFMRFSPVVFVVGTGRDEQDGDGVVRLEIKQQPRADDPVFPRGGKCEAQRGDDRERDETHLDSVFLTKGLKESEKLQVRY